MIRISYQYIERGKENDILLMASSVPDSMMVLPREIFSSVTFASPLFPQETRNNTMK
jgi:hypothetical protein